MEFYYDEIIDCEKSKSSNVKFDFYNAKDNSYWVNDFVYNFSSNWLQNPDEAESVYFKYEDKIINREYDSLPPLVFSDEFLSTLNQMIDLQYQQSFLQYALTIIHIFYFYNEEIELSPFQDIFMKLKSIFHDVSDERKDQMLKMLSYAVVQSHDFIIDLFPVEMLLILLKQKIDLLDSISCLVNGYSIKENDEEQSKNILRLSKKIMKKSIICKNGKLSRIFNTLPIKRALYAIQNICINESQSDFNPAIEFLFESKIDVILNLILQKTENFSVKMLKFVNYLYKNVRHLPSQISFDIIDGIEESKPILPKIEYANFVSYLTNDELFDKQEECLILSEKILSQQLIISQNKDQIYSYISQKNLLEVYQSMIEYGTFKLKIATLSSLKEFLYHIPKYLLDKIYEINLFFTLIDEIESDTADLTVLVLECLNLIIKRANTFGLPIQTIIDYFTENVDIDFEEEDDAVKDQHVEFISFFEE